MLKLGVLFLVLLVFGPRLVRLQRVPVDAYVEDLLSFFVPRNSDNSECRAHSELYIEQVLLGKDGALWAHQMLDSSAHAPSVGLLQGSVYNLGHFDLCLTAETGAAFQPKYFLVDVTFNLTQQSVLLPLVGSQRLRWGYCAPSSCSNEDVAGQVQSALAAMLGTSGSALARVRPGNSRALEDQRDVLDGGDIATVVLLSLLVCLVAIATAVDVRDLRRNNGKRDPAQGLGKSTVLAFSLYSNGRSLFSLARPRGSMTCLDGVRWFSIMWVMLGHRYSKENDLPAINHSEVTGMAVNWSSMIMMSCYVSVDTFFLLSGLLLSFVFLRNVQGAGTFSLAKFYLYRYIRLTPPLAMVIWIYARLLLHTGNGPLWFEVMSEKEVNCKARWWTNLLYVNNYVYPRSDEACVPQTWYLSVDMQFFVLSPVILYPLWKRPRLGYALMGVAGVLGTLAPFLLTYFNEFPWTSVWNQSSEDKMSYFVNMYCVVWTRSQPYLVGMALGVVLFRLRGKKVTIKPVYVVLGWLLAWSLALSVVFTLHIQYRADFQYSALDAAFYNGLHHLGWALAVAWVIFACEKGYGGPINSILSWPYFQPLARLSYCAYLTHIMVQLADVGKARATGHFSQYNTAHKFPGDLMFILLAAAAVSFTSEMPILTLEKIFLKKGPPPAKKEMKTQDVENGVSKEEDKK